MHRTPGVALPQVNRSSAPSTPATGYAAFAGVDACGPSLPLPFRLQRALLAAGVSDGANVTLLVLYQYAAVSIANGHVNDAGEVRVWVCRETLGEHRGVSARTIATHMRELQDCGAIRREDMNDRKKRSDMWVRSVPHLLSLLLDSEEARARLAARFPDTTGGKVTSLTEFHQRRGDVPARALGLELADDDLAAEVSIEQGKMNTMKRMQLRNSKVTDSLDEGTKKHAKSHAKAEAKREKKSAAAFAADTGRYTVPPVKQNLDTPVALLQMLRNCIKHDLGSISQPPVSGKTVAQCTTLAEQHGYDTARRLVEYTTTPAVWRQLQGTFKISLPYPTPGLLLTMADRWVPLALGESTLHEPKRSGGAGQVDLTAMGVVVEDGEF